MGRDRWTAPPPSPLRHRQNADDLDDPECTFDTLWAKILEHSHDLDEYAKSCKTEAERGLSEGHEESVTFSPEHADLLHPMNDEKFRLEVWRAAAAHDHEKDPDHDALTHEVGELIEARAQLSAAARMQKYEDISATGLDPYPESPEHTTAQLNFPRDNGDGLGWWTAFEIEDEGVILDWWSSGLTVMQIHHRLLNERKYAAKHNGNTLITCLLSYLWQRDFWTERQFKSFISSRWDKEWGKYTLLQLLRIQNHVGRYLLAPKRPRNQTSAENELAAVNNENAPVEDLDEWGLEDGDQDDEDQDMDVDMEEDEEGAEEEDWHQDEDEDREVAIGD